MLGVNKTAIFRYLFTVENGSGRPSLDLERPSARSISGGWYLRTIRDWR